MFGRFEFFAAVVVGLCATGCYHASSVLRRPSISRILKLDAPPLTSAAGVSEIAALDFAGLVAALKSERVSPLAHESAPSEDSMRWALQAIRHEDFWRTNWEIHPMSGRVRHWMRVHDRHRDALDGLLAETDRSKAKAAFDGWIELLDDHAEYRDGKLFRYFLDDPATPPAVAAELNTIMRSHEDRFPVEKISRILSSPDGGEWAGQTRSYVDGMRDRLLLEERALVGPLLNLDRAAYKRYRAYLSWKDATVY